MPRRRLAIHESLGRGEVPRWTAFDEIAGKREWRAREADDSRPSAELTLHLADRLQREGHLGRVERPQRGDVGGRADRPVDDRPDLGLDPHADTHRLEGQHDVGEEDGRVDAQFADRHQRDLGAKVWVLCEFEDPVVLPQFSVGGERPSRLTHEPDRRGIDRLMAAGPQEPIVHPRLASNATWAAAIVASISAGP